MGWPLCRDGIQVQLLLEPVLIGRACLPQLEAFDQPGQDVEPQELAGVAVQLYAIWPNTTSMSARSISCLATIGACPG